MTVEFMFNSVTYNWGFRSKAPVTLFWSPIYGKSQAFLAKSVETQDENAAACLSRDCSSRT